MRRADQELAGTAEISGSISPVFVVGCPRSGTTLLQRMLDAHPEIAVAPETHFVRRFWKKREQYGDIKQEGAFRRLLQEVAGIPEFADMALSPTDFEIEALRRPRTYANILALLLEMFGRQNHARVVGEKTPNHFLYVPILRGFFPGARFIYIVRDPRAVVLSLKTVPWSTRSVTANAEKWRRYAKAEAVYRRTCGADLHTVRYETLVHDPEPCLRRICEFVGVTYSAEMVRFHERIPRTLDLDREPWKAGVRNPLDRAAAHRWREALSRAEIAEIEAITWNGMRRHGYEFVSPLVQRSARQVIAVARRTVSRLRRSTTPLARMYGA